MCMYVYVCVSMCMYVYVYATCVCVCVRECSTCMHACMDGWMDGRPDGCDLTLVSNTMKNAVLLIPAPQTLNQTLQPSPIIP